MFVVGVEVGVSGGIVSGNVRCWWRGGVLGSTVGGISARVQYEVGACRYWRAECLDGGQCRPVVGGEVGMVYCGVHRGLGKRRVACGVCHGIWGLYMLVV